jgi:ankyrin repeat protein
MKSQYDSTSACPECAETHWRKNSYFSPTKKQIRCVDLAELTKHLNEDKNKLRDGDLKRCLFYCAKTGRKDLVTVLLNHDIDPNARILGRSSIIEASENGDEEILAQLLASNAHKADVNAPDIEGNTAFMFACSNGHYNIARMLLKHGVNIDAQNNQGSTAFLLACTMGRTKVVKLLLDHHADCLKSNDKGQSPLMLASFYGHKQVVKMLVGKTDIDVNAKDIHQDTALIFAAQRGQQDICRVLINAGARPDDQNLYNFSAKSYFPLLARRGAKYGGDFAALFRATLTL